MMNEEDLSITERGIEAHIVVAALVATVAFTAAITMPGGTTNKALQFLVKIVLLQSFLYQMQ
jgi:Tfp pilus assembly PilM family ATPase